MPTPGIPFAANRLTESEGGDCGRALFSALDVVSSR
jgi:hypothetical protein